MGKYLVTGAAGFIGAAVAKRLLGEGHRVISIDNLSTGSRSAIPAGVEFYESDCQNSEIYSEIPQVCYDAIFHIAGQSSGEVSFDDPVYDLRTNTESTLLLLKFAQKVGCRRFVYASSMSVYGFHGGKAVLETDCTEPESFYGVGKLASERYLKIYEEYGINTTSLRLFNVYGPGQNLKNMRQGMVSIFMAQMLNNGKIHVKGSADRYRDFVYIDDVVSAFLLSVECPSSFGQSINIATGIKTTVKQLVNKITSLRDTSVPIEYKGSTAGDILGIYADTQLARNVLGFEARVALDDGLEKMMSWCEEMGRL